MIITSIDEPLFRKYVESIINSKGIEFLAKELPFVDYSVTPFTNIARDLSDIIIQEAGTDEPTDSK